MLTPNIQTRYKIEYNRPIVALSPMAGVTDLPFRRLCESLGADFSITEMVASAPQLLKSEKNQSRLFFTQNNTVNIAQIIGNNPSHMAYAAQHYADLGAEIIDINLGCPAKKVSSKGAGSALLSDLSLTQKILESVTKNSPVPVTLKTRLGPTLETLTLKEIVGMAENLGIDLIAVHGRSRACKFKGQATFDEIADIKSQANISMLFNGDIAHPDKFLNIQQKTQCEGGLIGRASVGNPWIFSQIRQAIDPNFSINNTQQKQLILRHIRDTHDFYGCLKGVKFARKHIQSYLKHLKLIDQFEKLSRVENANLQLNILTKILAH